MHPINEYCLHMRSDFDILDEDSQQIVCLLYHHFAQIENNLKLKLEEDKEEMDIMIVH